ncbi:beta-ketoacyl synthase N-terminal-like domain-containing protein [Streptomyces hawaiiensis]|uniref:beta-ketoacyl synthase N-terminal-like domain-containing protein n=1 Tax=Streptomyces hawaiiensis TaxID=67305 RepID=UPI001FEB27F3|nr:beta-ketoacyl synthase N-terminal-like domain-containing protein [Streptomyces hawaiiensis]
MLTADVRGPGTTAPIAVVGLSCRFPGAAHPAEFWQNLMSGTDSVGEVPEGRWEARVAAASGTVGTPVRRGGFIAGTDEFDAGLFGIRWREAEHMDPQQRLLLELAWECLEDAAIETAQVRGRQWGVYVGACADDFRMRYFASGQLDRFGHMGTSRALLAGRVSHQFGLCGPSEVLDTGQSSSLAALHRAVSSLRLGECEAALVAGVNLNLLPDVTDQIQLWGGLSADGRCRTFDEGAGGYVRAEGGGCVVLKPLDAAMRDGDHVYCVIRGSAVNNDGGRAGLGVPSQDAQQAVIEAAHRAAGVTAADVTYVELHGTGTPVGDPVEARAIGEAIGAKRPQGDPVRVGSVKTNIGHLESAAGIAGFIKACLALRHEQLPPSLNYRRSPADLPLDKLNIQVVVRPVEQPCARGEVIGVSSFGMGGTNVHVVLGASPAEDHRAHSAAADTVWCLSGRSREAVRALAGALFHHRFPEDRYSVADVAWTLSHREQQEHRAAVVGGDWAEIREGLTKVVAGHDLAAPASWLQDAAPARTALVGLAGTFAYAGGIADVRERLGQGLRKVPGLPTYRFERETFTGPVHRAAAAPPPEPPAAARRATAQEADCKPPFAEQWARAATGADRRWLIRSLLERELLTVMGEPGEPQLRIDPDDTFRDMGIDSMSLIEFQDRIVTATSLAIPETALFDHPTINELTAHMDAELEATRG